MFKKLTPTMMEKGLRRNPRAKKEGRMVLRLAVRRQVRRFNP
jgi:hypothetical protein